MSDNEKKNTAKPIERVTISESLKSKLQALCDQANDSLQGMASVSKSDLVNLILDKHDASLSSVEIEALRNTHFDEVRFAQWMAGRLKAARNSGEAVSIMELIQQNNNLVSGALRRSPRRTKKKKHDPISEDQQKQLEDLP